MDKAAIRLINSSDPRWLTFAAGHHQADIFHHPAWMEFLQSCYGYRPMRLAMIGADDELVAILPLLQIDSWLTGRRSSSLPFSDFCPPLTTENGSLETFIEGLTFWRRQNKIPEIQVHWPLPDVDGVHPTEPFYRHITYLDPENQRVFRNFAKTRVQQPILKAEKDGVRIRMGSSWDDVLLFYGLQVKTRRRLGTPVQPLRFFRLLWERIIYEGLGFVLLAYKESCLLAGSVFLHFNEKLTYKYSASDPAFWKLRPNNLLLWHAICWGCERGFKVFDWGRTDMDNSGLRQFKLGWASEEQVLNYSILSDHAPRPSTIEQSRVLKSLLQYSPTWVCRMAGEIFYRHFG